MNPMQIILMIALGAFIQFIIEWRGWFKSIPCTEFDSPKDSEYYEIGEKLKVIDIEPRQISLLIKETKETNSFVWSVEYIKESNS